MIDRSHRTPALVAALMTLAIGLQAAWLQLVPHEPQPARGGGSPAGLACGAAAYAIIAGGVALWLRRRVPHWKLGSGDAWLRWHIWLSLASAPMVLFHCGGAVRGWLAGTVASLYAAVMASGVFGLALQQWLPRRMLHTLRRETVADQIPAVSAALIEEAGAMVRATCLAENVRGARGAAAHEGLRPGTRPLFDFFADHVRPFLEGRPSGMERSHDRAALFAHLRGMLPDSTGETVSDLESICEERADLVRQIMLERWLHGWLLVHAPASILLLIAATIHALEAMRFVDLGL